MLASNKKRSPSGENTGCGNISSHSSSGARSVCVCDGMRTWKVFTNKRKWIINGEKGVTKKLNIPHFSRSYYGQKMQRKTLTHPVNGEKNGWVRWNRIHKPRQTRVCVYLGPIKMVGTLVPTPNTHYTHALGILKWHEWSAACISQFIATHNSNEMIFFFLDRYSPILHSFRQRWPP